MEIPKQLQNPDFRFVLLGKGGTDKAKIPFEKNWQNKDYKFNDEKILNHIKQGNNFGIIGGFGNLIILDIDNKELAEEFEKKINTYTVKTGSGGRHFYFISDYNINHVLINELGELRANNYQVVCSGCLHPNGNYYEIVNDVPIQEISKEDLLKLIKPYLREENSVISDIKENKGKDTSRSGLEFRKLIALFRSGKTREQAIKEMRAYAKWVSSPDQYKDHQLDNAENYVLQEQENKNIIKEPTNFKKEKIIDYFTIIKEILKKYMDLDEDYYCIIAVWIIGTYLHKQFSSFPYLFFNATKGSGKTRLMKIVANLSRNGRLVGSMTEAVLFRTARERTLCIDELENLNAKGSENLKLLLNSAYKKGLTVERMKKTKTIEGEIQQVEEFEVFCPIVMANIWGLDNTLSDRCITLILEKSSKNQITKLIENFEKDSDFIKIRNELTILTQGFEIDLNLFGDVFEKWNDYVQNKVIVNEVSVVNKVNKVNVVNNSLRYYDIYDFTTTFKDISETDLTGRDLELFFPLFIVANMISKETLEELLEISKKITKQRKNSDREENIDVKLIEFISEKQYIGYVEVSKIVNDLKNLFGEDEKWINSRGISRALKRLNLILDRSSSGKARQVKLNIPKAKEKILMYKDPEKITPIYEQPKFTEQDFLKAGYSAEDLKELGIETIKFEEWKE